MKQKVFTFITGEKANLYFHFGRNFNDFLQN